MAVSRSHTFKTAFVLIAKHPTAPRHARPYLKLISRLQAYFLYFGINNLEIAAFVTGNKFPEDTTSIAPRVLHDVRIKSDTLSHCIMSEI